jgi:ATP-dependent RNA helicase DDX10/DBP4
MMKQEKRLALYTDFTKRPSCVLFATDIAARGLDFPAVDWVVQMDCPDTPETYIHRVGRTARYRSTGHGLLFLLPSEEKMATLLREKKVPMARVKANPNHLSNVSAQFQVLMHFSSSLSFSLFLLLSIHILSFSLLALFSSLANPKRCLTSRAVPGPLSS